MNAVQLGELSVNRRFVRFATILAVLLLTLNVCAIAEGSITTTVVNNTQNGDLKPAVPGGNFGGKKFQTLYLLHGGQGSNRDFLKYSNINRWAEDNCIAVVMPSCPERFYEDKYFSYVTGELPILLRSMLPLSGRREDNFIGGLATHTSGMIKVAQALCGIYPSLDRDYLIAGVILHDLGKIEELSSPVVTEYTTEGKLLGHISIMDARLLQIGMDLGLEDSEELLLLRHMVLSHHGQYEYGSPVRPETMEAEVLNLVDNIDARINTIDKALDEIREGEFTQKIFALDNRVFYKHK